MVVSRTGDEVVAGQKDVVKGRADMMTRSFSARQTLMPNGCRGRPPAAVPTLPGAAARHIQAAAMSFCPGDHEKLPCLYPGRTLGLHETRPRRYPAPVRGRLP